MTKDRHAEFLAWLIGANRHVVFDEAHLGIVDSPGVATLMQRYRLHGLALGLLLAGLFIWKNSTSYRPAPARGATAGFRFRKRFSLGVCQPAAAEYFAARLRWRLCFAEWKKSAAPAGKFSNARLQQAEAMFQAENSRPAGERNPVATYQQISETLGNRKKTIMALQNGSRKCSLGRGTKPAVIIGQNDVVEKALVPFSPATMPSSREGVPGVAKTLLVHPRPRAGRRFRAHQFTPDLMPARPSPVPTSSICSAMNFRLSRVRCSPLSCSRMKSTARPPKPSPRCLRACRNAW